MTSIRHFWSDEQGQDWTFVLSFVALVSLIVFVAAGADLPGLWTPNHVQLLAANTCAG